MATDNAPGPNQPISREKLLHYRAGCLTTAEMDEVRRAVEQDPRLADCCKEEESFDRCIERCCKKEAPSSDLKSRIQARLAETAAAAPAAAAAATASAKSTSPANHAPASLPHAPVRRPVFGGVLVGLAAMVIVATGIVAWSYRQQQSDQPKVAGLDPNIPVGHLDHDPNNVIDQIAMNFDEHPQEIASDQAQVIDIVNPVGLKRAPQSPAIAHLISVTGSNAPIDHQQRMVKVCYQCTGHQTWNLTVLKATPALLDALHMHACCESKNSKRTYFMCGDKTGKQPCAVFWEQDGKVMILVAETSSEHIISMSDSITLCWFERSVQPP
ncbi:MAG TPA: hypothetical protein VL860_07255 [Planctomycetota bacterium]|nr:hypothetical protein [Planctomycetota bacterium]